MVCPGSDAFEVLVAPEFWLQPNNLLFIKTARSGHVVCDGFFSLFCCEFAYLLKVDDLEKPAVWLDDGTPNGHLLSHLKQEDDQPAGVVEDDDDEEVDDMNEDNGASYHDQLVQLRNGGNDDDDGEPLRRRSGRRRRRAVTDQEQEFIERIEGAGSVSSGEPRFRSGVADGQSVHLNLKFRKKIW